MSLSDIKSPYICHSLYHQRYTTARVILGSFHPNHLEEPSVNPIEHPLHFRSTIPGSVWTPVHPFPCYHLTVELRLTLQPWSHTVWNPFWTQSRNHKKSGRNAIAKQL